MMWISAAFVEACICLPQPGEEWSLDLPVELVRDAGSGSGRGLWFNVAVEKYQGRLFLGSEMCNRMRSDLGKSKNASQKGQWCPRK